MLNIVLLLSGQIDKVKEIANYINYIKQSNLI